MAVGALLLAAAFNTSLSAWLFTRRVRTAARPLAVMTLATAIWQVTYALELLGGSDGTSTDWVKYQHIGIAVLPVAWFVFAVRYVGASRLLGRSTRALLLALPVVHLALAFTNDWHRLVWRNWTLVHQPFPIHRAEYGAWFWGFAASSHLLILGGIVLLAWPRVGARGLYARQGRFLAAVALAPWLANAAYLFRLGPVPGLDLTPFGFTLASAVFALNVVPLRLLDLVPIARSAV
ncbi:MAG TPA: histidine kinase N-terminal 7TM domain-containing protein, partial [Candidatus Krumholzibacteria bacterium]